MAAAATPTPLENCVDEFASFTDGLSKCFAMEEGRLTYLWLIVLISYSCCMGSNLERTNSSDRRISTFPVKCIRLFATDNRVGDDIFLLMQFTHASLVER